MTENQGWGALPPALPEPVQGLEHGGCTHRRGLGVQLWAWCSGPLQGAHYAEAPTYLGQASPTIMST